MDAHKFGAFVAQCRKERNMTQAELASKIQVTDKAVSRWERGIGFPDINTIEPLASALEVSVLELMKSERMAGRYNYLYHRRSCFPTVLHWGIHCSAM